MIRLLTTYFNENNVTRRLELEYCLKKNIENPLIEKIFILSESTDSIPYKSNKIKPIETSKRPTFQDFLSISRANESDESITAIANTDIFFDHSLIYISDFDLRKTVLSLTRWDLLNNGNTKFFNVFNSADTWIFNRTPSTENIGTYFLGQPGCDTRFNYDLVKSAYKILNPAFTIRTFHLHNSGHRTYTKASSGIHSVPPPHYLKPVDLTIRDSKQNSMMRSKLKTIYKYNHYSINKQIFLGLVKRGDFHPYASSRLLALIRMLWFYNYFRKKVDIEFLLDTFAVSVFDDF